MTIDVEIFGRNMEITQQIDTYVTRRASRLDRYLSGIGEARVDLAYVKTARNAGDRSVAQITVRGKKIILRSEKRAVDVFVAFDRALDKMQRQISRYKGKHYRGRGDGKSLGEVVGEEMDLEEELDPETPVIARRKIFTLAPMDELEALEQMKLLGHEDFFVFFNVATNSVNVLYLRRDGTYGLIVPDLG